MKLYQAIPHGASVFIKGIAGFARWGGDITFAPAIVFYHQAKWLYAEGHYWKSRYQFVLAAGWAISIGSMVSLGLYGAALGWAIVAVIFDVIAHPKLWWQDPKSNFINIFKVTGIFKLIDYFSSPNNQIGLQGNNTADIPLVNFGNDNEIHYSTSEVKFLDYVNPIEMHAALLAKTELLVNSALSIGFLRECRPGGEQTNYIINSALWNLIKNKVKEALIAQYPHAELRDIDSALEYFSGRLSTHPTALVFTQEESIRVASRISGNSISTRISTTTFSTSGASSAVIAPPAGTNTQNNERQPLLLSPN